MVIVNLLCSQSYDLSPKIKFEKDGTDNTTIDIEAFKVLISMVLHGICIACLTVCMMANNIAVFSKMLPPIVIVTILTFNLIFNIAGCTCLWLHNDPKSPPGYSPSIRGSAVMSSIGMAYNFCTTFYYCIRLPPQGKKKSAEVVLKEEGSKVKKDEKKEKEKESKPAKELKEPVSSSGTNVKKALGSGESAETREQSKQNMQNVNVAPAPKAEVVQKANYAGEQEIAQSKEKLGEEAKEGANLGQEINIVKNAEGGTKDVKTAMEILEPPAHE
ncbi:unnamed protein product [Strongylus vulgaris]|uniref:Uncharacterized protein n=1 Tax=Strongylus vulgaris TaxID=40348 RepID=A0A3P7HZY3_STRVU|nr:unnamed protein product [Strongylus vulgaris]